MKSLTLAVAVLVVIAAAVAAYAVISHRGGASQAAATSPASTPQATSAGGGSVARAGSLSDCGSPAVAVVYAEGQEQLAEKMAELLSQQVKGDVPPGTRFCVVPVAGAPGLREARVLPLILVKASNVSGRLAKTLLNTSIVDGWRPVRYDVDAVFAVQVAYHYRLKERPLYHYKAELVVVQGHIPVTRADVKAIERDKAFLDLVAAVAATGISNVTEAEPGSVPLPRGAALPTLLYHSNQNLSAGVPSLKSLGDGYYTLTSVDYSRVLLGRGYVEAREVPVNPPLALLASRPSVGKGSVGIAIFEDFMCPFCARLYNETMPYLLQLAEQGKVRIYFLDLLIHANVKQVVELHRLLDCYYARTHNSTGYLHAVEEIYRVVWRDMSLIQSRRAGTDKLLRDLDNLYKELSKRLNASPDCPEATSALGLGDSLAKLYGIRGTPGFLAWRNGTGFVVVTEGFRTKQFFQKLVAELENAPAATSGKK